MRVAICEDVPSEADQLLSILTELDCEHEITIFHTGEDLMAVFKPGEFQLVFLDIRIGEENGVEIAKEIRAVDWKVQLVFTTHNKEYALECYETEPLHFLVKPVKTDDVDRVLQRCKTLFKQMVFPLIRNGELSVEDVMLENIMYIEANNRNCRIHMVDEILESRMTIEELDAIFAKDQKEFCRCHRSYIVNLNHVRQVSRDFYMKNGDIVYIRRGDVKLCEMTFQNHLMKKVKNIL